jgi:hypothetical protein
LKIRTLTKISEFGVGAFVSIDLLTTKLGLSASATAAQTAKTMQINFVENCTRRKKKIVNAWRGTANWPDQTTQADACTGNIAW